jgi:hypothetical protein
MVADVVSVTGMIWVSVVAVLAVTEMISVSVLEVVERTDEVVVYGGCVSLPCRKLDAATLAVS